MVHMDDKGGQGLVAMQKLWDRHLHKHMKPILQGLGVTLLSQAGNMQNKAGYALQPCSVAGTAVPKLCTT